MTLGEAYFPSDSDPEDEDYVLKGVTDVPVPEVKVSNQPCDSLQEKGGRWARLAEQVWNEICLESEKELRRISCTASDPLLRTRRAEPRPKASWKQVLADVSKLSGVLPDTAPLPPTAAEMKARVRSKTEEPSRHGDEGQVGKPAGSWTSGEVVVEDVVQFAGSRLVFRRRLKRGSYEERKLQSAAKRRRTATLGGGLSPVDDFLGISLGRAVTVVEKSGIDWEQHKAEHQLGNLQKGSHAGVLEEQAFLKRAADRVEAQSRAAARAAERAAARAKAEDASAPDKRGPRG